MRVSSVLLMIGLMLPGCVQVKNPVTLNQPSPTASGVALPGVSAGTDANAGPHRLWGEWTLYINETHDGIDVVPVRHTGFHLNATKFLEDYCSDCLEITNIHNNGDSTIDLTLSVTHPFPMNPEYTGFDVKGILMFQGSHECRWGSVYMYPFEENFRISWWAMGDPEVMNPDGYTPRWNPDYDSGSSLPMFSYWPGKFSNGIPTANLNAFLNFYTDEERHMFRVGETVERVYTIWLPPGPVVAGYAIEACWEPPTVMPVTNPVNDFPITANQPEPYYFDHVLNNNEVIDYTPCCGTLDGCENLWADVKQWYGDPMTHYVISYPEPRWSIWILNGIGFCSEQPSPPPNDYSYYLWLSNVTEDFPDGYYRGVAVIKRNVGLEPEVWAYDVYDFTIDLE